ncbi:hypothetical protein ABFS82_08G123900 [Erythranthe guttata]|nr:PREDICTED: probable WRKY transcription factor 35 [Erythranthe guttata]|eukprot:XP_012830494.1 PREDICTED: probable WRKY transcription factor 35 [Erythranthe guttata]
MCSPLMENYQGDLADIFRPSTTTATVDGGDPDAAAAALPDWQFPTNPITYSSDPVEDFGDPFNYMGNPLLPAVPGFFSCNNSNIIDGGGGINNSGAGGVNISHRLLVHDEMRKPSNIFSRMLQISPNAKSPVDHSQAAAAAAASPTAGLRVSPILVSKGCLVESPGGLQISSPRNTGIKRRKSQAKKVVCIPASSPANSRATGEIVPSDLWAWRKYGQKPIKGSPYPRGYYRCSSSKGCSARKQVERSRTDPNMLVITYTSEHNHPWPTQRNALAGSTRSQPSSKTTTTTTTTTTKKDPTKQINNNNNNNTVIITQQFTTDDVLKEEEEEEEITNNQDFDHQLEMDHKFELGFQYNPTLLEDDHHNFFADLGEIEADEPLEDLLFTPGEINVKDLDFNPFSFYSWSAATTTTAATTASSTTASYGEDNKES